MDRLQRELDSYLMATPAAMQSADVADTNGGIAIKALSLKPGTNFVRGVDGHIVSATITGSDCE